MNKEITPTPSEIETKAREAGFDQIHWVVLKRGKKENNYWLLAGCDDIYGKHAEFRSWLFQNGILNWVLLDFALIFCLDYSESENSLKN